MAGDFVINIAAGVALLIAGFVSRQAVSRFRTRATRRLWREAISEDLTIALSANRDIASMSGPRVSFAEVRTLVSLTASLSRHAITYGIVESFIGTASRITDKHVLLL